jgi:7-carboxy-7-deazaguanine synthase
MFVRAYDCNLHCTWCDTAYTWANTPGKAALTLSGKVYDKDDPHLGLKEMSPDDILGEIHQLWDYLASPTTVVFSGGEPMMQQADILEVGRALRNWQNEVHIETAGTIFPKFDCDYVVTQYNVSPKLEHSGNRVEHRYKPHVLRALTNTNKAWFKFVVTADTSDDDFKEIDNIVKECRIPVQRVQVMPEGTTSDKIVETGRKIVDMALSRGYGLSLRTHISLWGEDPDK